MKDILYRPIHVAIMICWLALAGCLGGPSGPTNFYNQWAEPLNDNLTRVLEENLTNLLHEDLIDVFLASDSSIPADYRLEVDVLRLDGNLGGQAALVVQWALLAAEEDELILMRRSEYQEPAADNTYKGLVLAKSRTVEKLSRDMTAAIKKALAK